MQLLVVLAIDQRAPCRLTVPAGAAELLIERLDRAREVGMNHEADVGLVDPQSEGIGRHHDRDLSAHEPVLAGGPIGGLHPAMVGGHLEASGAQARGQVVECPDRRHVDDSAALGPPQEIGHLLLPLLLVIGGGHREMEVGPIEPGMDDPGVGDVQLFENIFDHLLGRRRGEGEHGRPAKLVDDRAQALVLGTEVMPPLADAMRLVDDEEVEWHTAQQARNSGSASCSGVV